MANKRLKKKQQTKSTIRLLESVGITDKKKVKQLKNKPKESQKVYKSAKRNIVANERSHFMRNVLGLKMDKDHQRIRYWGEERYNKWVQQEEKKAKKREYNRQYRERKKQEKIEKERKKFERLHKNDNDLYLLIFWKEKTEGYADEHIIEDFKHEYRHMSKEYLIESILGFLSAKLPSLIGTYNIQIVRGSQRAATKHFMKSFDEGMMADWNNWLLVYEGKADMRRYKELLLAIHTVIRLLYDNEEKAGFIGDLITKFLPAINKETAKQLAKDLHYRSGGF